MKSNIELLNESNELIRSFKSVIDRKGEQTNWDALNRKTEKLLTELHELLRTEMKMPFPEQYPSFTTP